MNYINALFGIKDKAVGIIRLYAPSSRDYFCGLINN